MSLYQDIYDIVKRIPVATVTSYGRIARMVNCNARQVGYAMAATPDDQAIPWHRVINSKGEISARKQGGSDQQQRQKLIDEGVVFDQKGRVSFDEFGWRTAEIPPISGDWSEDWPEDWPLGKMKISLPKIIICSGEPAGIGPDIVIKAAQQGFDATLAVVGDPNLLRYRAELLGIALDINEYQSPDKSNPCYPAPPGGRVLVIPLEVSTSVTLGQLDSKNSRYVIQCIDTAVDLCRSGEFDAMVTAPVHKGIINDAGIPFSGHTEWIAKRTGADQPVMMLANGTTRVCLVTTHLPLKEVPGQITVSRIKSVLEVMASSLTHLYRIPDPRIGVCGLNPHAGEGGHLGTEEIEIIQPAILEMRQQGFNLIGPLPADTAFTQTQLSQLDGVLAMYHDQGLPVIKHSGFGEVVNVTLGLPIIRTSVDHGTALELAGSGLATASSLVAAINLAIEFAGNR
ncbi:4-hydroxythreonine-4-phosphate dehydrogenase PdxA [Candidatus Spongiihabitans sp.]|uniref:4-hydroxythreonine-4-phosphate dehydrogenase PdxA n=1 Tax=Candidatus Spongiihabitans sp. TaxID=3101308 RepID=UPI003C6FEC27